MINLGENLMKYFKEDVEKLTRQFDKLKKRTQELGKWHFHHGHNDAAKLWTILYTYLDEMVKYKPTRFIREPIFEITLYPSRKLFSIKANKSTCSCFKGYFSQSSEFDNIISDLSDMLLKYGLYLSETEESIKQKSKKHALDPIRQYTVKYVEEKE